MDHLDAMDYLRTGIGLRGYGQRDPLVEYQREGRQLFAQLMGTIETAIIDIVFKAEAVREETTQGVAVHPSSPTLASPTATTPAPTAQAQTDSEGQLHNPYKDVGRNDPCPCGSGKKFKKCHGA